MDEHEKQKLHDATHWTEDQLAALCSDDVSQRGQVMAEISKACRAGRLYATETGKGNALYGGQWSHQRWKPWLQSTVPRTERGKAAAAANSRKHGLFDARSRDLMRCLHELLREQREALKRL